MQMAGLGEACSVQSACKSPPFEHCRATGASGDGYCTRAGCASSAECPAGYACDSATQPSTCKRPPTGQGKACASAADCAGLEATHCETAYLKQCLVEGCKLDDPSSCHEGWKCCDVTALGLPKTLCLKDQCPAP